MEVLFKQRFQFANIEIFQNYSRLVDNPASVRRTIKKETDPTLNVDFLSELLDYTNNCHPSNVLTYGNPKYREVRLPEKSKKNRCYFDSGIDKNGEFIGIRRRGVFTTVKDRQIKKHYGNPFAEIFIHTYEKKISRNGDKLTFKFYHHTKSRQVNWKFFKKSNSIVSLTINTKTGNFTIIESENNGKRKFYARVNNFKKLRSIILESRLFNSENKDQRGGEFKVNTLFNEALNNKDFYEKIYELFDITELELLLTGTKHLIFKKIIESFVERKKIKTPNNYPYLLINFYPTEKYLKKNDRKLVAAVLDCHGIKSKSTIKILHSYPGSIKQLRSLVEICGYFGEDYGMYISKIDPNFFRRKSTDNDLEIMQNQNEVYTQANKTKDFVLDSFEKTNLVKFLSSYCQKEDDFLFSFGAYNLREIYDHFNMISIVREFYPDWRFRATTQELFVDEHKELSKITTLIRKGTSIEYIFNAKMVKSIEEPIVVVNKDYVSMTFYPVILKKEEEYIEEGSHMHHCVATYAEKNDSMIVSLRADSPFGRDRVTSEYQNNNGLCLQSRYFCNAVPPEYFQYGLTILQSRIIKWRYDLKPVDKKRTVLTLNGVEVKPKPDTEWQMYF